MEVGGIQNKSQLTLLMSLGLILMVCANLTYFSFVLDGLFDQKGYKNISVLQANILSVVFAVNL